MEKIKQIFDKILNGPDKSSNAFNYKLVVFNIFIVFLFLLRSAGYFQPYFLISVNFIVMVGLVLSVLLLGARSNIIFIVAFLFWIFAGFIKIFKIDVWVERTGIYAYESLVFGVLLYVYERLGDYRKK